MKFHILYGSQTGNAEAIAKRIQDSLSKIVPEECILPTKAFNSFSCGEFSLCDYFVLVCSTTGDGDPPDNAQTFLKELRGLQENALNQVKFGLLGLGDSNYSTFCGGPKRIQSRLLALGAVKFVESAFADDGVGLEVVVEPWIQALEDFVRASSSVAPSGNWKAEDDFADSLMRKVELSVEDLSISGTLTNVPRLPVVDKEGFSVVGTGDRIENEWMAYENYWRALSKETEIRLAPIVSMKKMTKSGAVKEAFLFNLSVNFPNFQPGDCFSVFAPNNHDFVLQLLLRLRVDGSLVVNFPAGFCPLVKKPISLYDYFRFHCDVGAIPKKSLVRLLAEYAADEIERKKLLFLSSKQGAEEYLRLRTERCNLLSLLQLFPSCNPPWEAVVQHSPQLSPRSYSIASSPLKRSERVSFVFNASTAEYPGLATSWFKHVFRLSPTEPFLPLTFRPSNGFRLPADHKKAVIMIGPGTGVAPFVGFIQHRNKLRNAQEIVGPTVLFYGCKDRSKDYLFEAKLEKYKRSGSLDALFVAVSQEEAYEGSRHVQQDLEAESQRIYELMEAGGYLYVCGNSGLISRSNRPGLSDITKILTGIIAKHGNLPIEQASQVLMSWIEEGRYLKDVWG